MGTGRRVRAATRALTSGRVLGVAAAPGSARQRQACPNLWATVNICNSAHYPDVVSALGFPARLRMVFEVGYCQDPNSGFRRLPCVAPAVDLGEVGRGVYQAGVRFQLQPRAGADYGDPRGFSDWRRAIP